jgi:hypothetical protein
MKKLIKEILTSERKTSRQLLDEAICKKLIKLEEEIEEIKRSLESPLDYFIRETGLNINGRIDTIDKGLIEISEVYKKAKQLKKKI